MSEELQDLERAYSEALRKRLPVLRAQRFNSVPLPALIWMAVAPSWPLNLATRGFPVDGDGLGTGDLVEQVLERMRSARLVNCYDSGSVALGPSYRMDRGQRAAAIQYVLELRGEAGLDEMREQLRNAGEAVRAADVDAQILSLSQPLLRWLPLALRAGSLREMAAHLDSEVEKELKEARAREHLDSPATRRWIDTAEPLADIFGGMLNLAVHRAKRRLELLRRDGIDIRHLSNYLEREEQDQAFQEFIGDADNELWALHYVGEGGAGKTMLVRHIMFQLAPQQQDVPLAIARIDFDSLNPHYPSRAPGLLLMALAEELRLRGNIPYSVFRRFDDKVRAVHERLEGALQSGERVSDEGIVAQEFDSVIAAFTSALKNLKARPLFILDTCEELAKVTSDGAPPDNVEATFRVLEALHKELPHMRVIFSGRRALASAGAGWTTPSTLPPRPFLRLHEIRGFAEEEARHFLSHYTKDGDRVVPELFDPIINRSVLSKAGAALRFGLADGHNGEDPSERYNPYELDLYAAWACSEKRPDAQTLINGGLFFYVRERIIGRLSRALTPLLPAFIRLRVFDREAFEQLLDALEPQAVAGQTDWRQTLFEDLIGQEWMSLAPGGQEWIVDVSMWRRLSEFYAEEERAMWSAAGRPASKLLRRITLSRSLHELSLAHFEAALRAQAEMPAKVPAHWWQLVETRLAAEEAWPWALNLTNFLLSDEGPVGSAGEPESVLRPAVLATNSAARINLAANDPRLLSNWEEIRVKAELHPTPRGAARLRFRAIAGRCAYFQWQRDTHHPALLDEFLDLLQELPRAAAGHDAQTCTAEFALLESLVDTVEHLNSEWDAVRETVFCGKLNAIYLKLFGEPNAAAERLPPELRAYSTLLRARLEKLCLQHVDAVTSFHEAIDLLPQSEGGGGGKRCWLGWRPPDDLRARVQLEFVRGVYPAYFGPDYVLARIPPPSEGGTIDADRLRSALLWLESQLHPAADSAGPWETAADESHGARSGPVGCNAHRDFAPYFLTALEADADLGWFDNVLSKASEFAKQAETESNLHLKKSADRVLLRLALRARLYDEKGLYAADTLAGSNALDDIALRCALGALRGYPPEITLKSLAGGSPKRETVLNHIAWRSNQAEIEASERSLVAAGGNFSHTTAPHELATWLDGIEAACLDGDTSGAGWVKMLVRLEKSGRRWARAHATEPAEAIRQYLRILALISPWLGDDPTLIVRLERETARAAGSAAPAEASAGERDDIYALLLEKVGKRRGAEIALEEGTLLALRLPDSADYLVRMAHRWYGECDDYINCFLSTLRQALTSARSTVTSRLNPGLTQATTDYARCLGRALGVPPLQELFQGASAEDKNSTTTIAELAAGMEAHRSWRPWFIRWFVCLAREREHGKPGPKLKASQQWLEQNYSIIVLNQPRLSPELQSLFLYGGRSGPVTIIRDQEQTAPGGRRLKKTLEVAGYAFAIVAFIFVNLALLIVSEPLLDAVGFAVTTLKTLSLQFGTFALLAGGAYAFIRAHSTRISVGHEKEITDASRPLLTPARLRLNYYIRAFNYLYAFGAEAQTGTADEVSYRELTEILPKTFIRRLRRLGRWSRLLRLNMDVCVIVDEKNSAAPWEAIFELAAGGAGASGLHLRRQMKTFNTPRLKPLSLPLTALSLIAETDHAELATLAWATTPAATKPETKQLRAKNDAPPGELLHDLDSTVSLAIERRRTDVGILHLVGLARETSQRVRLEIRPAGGNASALGAADPDVAADEGGSTAAARGTLLWAEEITRQFPQLRICLLQTLPSGFEDESRTSDTRYAAGLSRRFGADLFNSGIPAVIVLPPLDAEVSVRAINLLARDIAEAARNPRLGSNPAHALMSAVGKMRDLISREGHPDSEVAAEMAYDLCLYLNERFDLLIDRKSQ